MKLATTVKFVCEAIKARPHSFPGGRLLPDFRSYLTEVALRGLMAWCALTNATTLRSSSVRPVDDYMAADIMEHVMTLHPIQHRYRQDETQDESFHGREVYA